MSGSTGGERKRKSREDLHPGGGLCSVGVTDSDDEHAVRRLAHGEWGRMRDARWEDLSMEAQGREAEKRR